MTFPELIHPVGISEIRDAIDRGEIAHFARGSGAPGRELMNPEILARLADRLGALGKLRVFRNGAAIPQETMKSSPGGDFSGAALRQLARKGASVVASRLEDHSPALDALAIDLERRLGCSATIGVIATFGAGCALKAHWDPEDVIAIQVAGRKKWMILGDRHRGRVNDKPTSDPPAGISREIWVEEGDILVVPRGYWHRCHGDGDSLQLTALMCRTTGVEFAEAIARRASEDPLFHRAIPLGRDPGESAELGKAWRFRLGETAREASVPKFSESDDRARRIPTVFGSRTAEPFEAGSWIELAARRPLAIPEPPEKEIRAGGFSAPATAAAIAVARILNREISLPTRNLLEELAGELREEDIAAAILALDKSCLAVLKS
jgi:oxalate decarboxylase/phosphoglucose isomerase-like protein (cupin superfamily)